MEAQRVIRSKRTIAVFEKFSAVWRQLALSRFETACFAFVAALLFVSHGFSSTVSCLSVYGKDSVSRQGLPPSPPSDMDFQTIQTSLHSAGVRIDPKELMQNLSSNESSDSILKGNLSADETAKGSGWLDLYRIKQISADQFAKNMYFLKDPADIFHFRFDRDVHLGRTIADTLNRLEPKHRNQSFGLASNTWLPGLLKVAEIRGKDSQSPSQIYSKPYSSHFKADDYVSVVLWTGTEATFGETATIDLTAPRVVVSGKLNRDSYGGSTIDVHTVEMMIFNESTKTWSPHLYEFVEGKLQRVFESEDGVHSIQKCMRCHGFGTKFSPVPFKFRPDYEPSPGWFQTENPREKNRTLGFGFWGVSGATSLYAGIKVTSFDANKLVQPEIQNKVIDRFLKQDEVTTVYESGLHLNWHPIKLPENATTLSSISPHQRKLIEVKETLLKEKNKGALIVFFDQGSPETHIFLESSESSLNQTLLKVKQGLGPKKVIAAYRVFTTQAGPETFLPKQQELLAISKIQTELALRRPVNTFVFLKVDDGQVICLNASSD